MFGTKTIELSQDQVTQVDADEFETLSKYKWYAQWDKGTQSFYAVRSSGRVKMHRVIMSAPVGLVVDHIDGNTLDNRKENLRLVTFRENQQNRHRPKSSVYPGVSWHKGNSLWRTCIQVEGKRLYLGYYATEREAFDSYVTACRVYGFAVDLMLERFKED